MESNLLSPHALINTLPPEPLGAIFELVVYPCCECTGEKNIKPQLILSSVCSMWRRIAAGAPALWSHVHILIESGSQSNRGVPNFRRIQLWLERSAGMPIHLFLKCDKYTAKQQQDIPEFLSNMLQKYVASLKTLVLTGKGAASIALILFPHPALGYLSSLKNLAFYNSCVPVDETVTWQVELFEGLSVLELSWSDYPPHFGFNKLAIALSNCPTLHTLRLQGLSPSLDLQVHTPINLPCLKLLDLYRVDVECQRLLLSVLVPGTCELDVRFDFDNRTTHQLAPYIESFFARSNIVSVAIRVDAVRGSAWFKPCLLAAPNLRSMVLDMEDYDGIRVPQELLVLYECDLPRDLPSFQSLCLTDGSLNALIRDELERVISGPKLRNIAFISCSFPPRTEADRTHKHSFQYTEVPGDMGQWLSTRTENLIVIHETPSNWFESFIDIQIQRLMKLE